MIDRLDNDDDDDDDDDNAAMGNDIKSPLFALRCLLSVYGFRERKRKRKRKRKREGER